MDLEVLLLKVVGELPASTFATACGKAGLKEEEINLIIDELFERVISKEGV